MMLGVGRRMRGGGLRVGLGGRGAMGLWGGGSSSCGIWVWLRLRRGEGRGDV